VSVFHCLCYFCQVTPFMQMSIQYYMFLFQLLRLTSHTNLTLVSLFYQIFYIRTHNIIPILPYLSQVYNSPIDCQVPSCQIHWLHDSVYPLVSCKPWYEPYLFLSMPHSVSTPQFMFFDSHPAVYMFSNICMFILGLLINIR
jgi:hypothetical protein